MLTYSGFFGGHCSSAELYNTLPLVFCPLTDLHWVTVLLSLLGKAGSSSAFSTVFLYSAEFFPTTVRNSALGVANFSARLGGMIAPYIVDLVLTIS